MNNGCLFLNGTRLNFISYYGYYYSFFVNNNKINHLFGKFSINLQTKIMVKNIPKKYILITEKYILIDYYFKTKNKSKNIFIYVCTNPEQLNISFRYTNARKFVKQGIINYYRSLFNTKIKANDRILEKYFNVILPKAIISESVSLDLDVISKYSDKSFEDLEILYNQKHINSLEFYEIIKKYLIGITDNQSIVKIRPNVKSLIKININDLQINIENRNVQTPYMIFDNIKFYNLWSINKKYKPANFPITLVI